MTKDEIALIVGWLANPDSFDFMVDAHRALLCKAQANVAELTRGFLFWARFNDATADREVVRVSLRYDELKVERIGIDGNWEYSDFTDYVPIALPPVNSPS